MNRVAVQSLESPFRRFTRDEWAQLRADTQLTLTIDDLRKLQSTHDPISIDEVVAIYLPLSRLLALYVAATQGLFKATQQIPRRDRRQSPLHYRDCRVCRRRKVDHGARIAGAPYALAEHAQGAARHDRRLPAPQLRTDPARNNGPQGLSREL